MSRPGSKPWPPLVGGEHSRKEPFKQLVNSYLEHLHMSARPVENACDKLILILTASHSSTQFLNHMELFKPKLVLQIDS
jgi:hypothetical protein